MNTEKKEKLIQEIVGILHKEVGTMYDGKGVDDEARIALDEDYFEDAAFSIYCHCENMFSYHNRKNLTNSNPSFTSEIASLIKQAIDKFNSEWTSHEEQVAGINFIALDILVATQRNIGDKMAYLENEVNRLRLKEEELGYRLLKADGNAKSRLDNYNKLLSEIEQMKIDADAGSDLVPTSKVVKLFNSYITQDEKN